MSARKQKSGSRKKDAAEKPAARAPGKRKSPGKTARAETQPPGRYPPELVKRAIRLSNKLRKFYAGQGTALKCEDPFQLLVATILSAQCTDDQVNRTTPALFAAYPTAARVAAAKPRAIEKLIYQTGFYRQKTRNIQAMARSLVEKYGGRVPESMQELTALAGVGRKTANLVRAEAFGRPAVIVDTHVKRVSRRLGLHDLSDPTKIELRIADLLPPSHWTDFSDALIWHGRRYCSARKPKCSDCPVLDQCPFGAAEIARR